MGVGGKRLPRGAPRLRSAVAGLSADGAGVVPWCHPAELGVWALFVVVAPPVLQHGAGVRQRPEQGLGLPLRGDPVSMLVHRGL